MSRRPAPPGAFGTKDPSTRDDFRRMRVWLEQLGRDVDALQSQVDGLPTGGGGSGDLTGLTSTDSSVAITNAGGPVPDLSVPVYDVVSTDGTVSVSGGPTFDLSVPSSGGGSTHVCSFEDLPVVANVDDEEFDGTSLPAGWQVFAPGAGGAIGGYDTSASGDISWNTPIAGASNIKLQVNHPKKPSHLLVECNSGTSVIVAKQVTLSSLCAFRFRWSVSKPLGATSPREMYVGIFRDVGGRPEYDALGHGDFILAGINGSTLWVLEGTAGFPTQIQFSSAFDPRPNGEFIFVCDSSTNVYTLYRNDHLTTQLFNHAPPSLYTAGGLVWVGLFNIPGGGVPQVAALDYVRRQNDKDFF